MLITHEPRRARGEHGVAISLVALLLLPLLAAAALAIDLGGWFARASEIQRSADAAALAGVTYLPQGAARATTEARKVATRNGYTDGVDGVTVSVADVGANRLRVTITVAGVRQTLSDIFRDQVAVTRTSTAEFVQPVPMGSPRNYLGTYRTQGSGINNPAQNISPANQENFWLSASGYCARREHGDRITPRTDSNGGATFDSCIPSGGAGSSSVIANSEWSADGYFYAIEFESNYSGAPRVEVFDAAHCEGSGSGASDSGTVGGSGPGGRSGQRQYTWTLRANDSLNPTLATPIAGPITIGPADCGTWANQWRTLFNMPANPTRGTYFLQIKPVVPAAQSGDAAQEGQNQFSLRVADPAGFSPCSSDPNITPFTPGRNCPNVYGLTHLGVYAQGSGVNPSFYLASVADVHTGKTMQIELFDTAEGADAIQLRDPTGANYPFTWEVACMDGSYRSENGGSCRTATGEVPPPSPGYGPIGNVTSIDVSGANNAWRPWGGRNSQNGRYSDRLLRLTVRLPGHPLSPSPTSSIAGEFGPLTWWRIAYTCSACGDRTTWSINIQGDPVRLVPNT